MRITVSFFVAIEWLLVLFIAGSAVYLFVSMTWKRFVPPVFPIAAERGPSKFSVSKDLGTASPDFSSYESLFRQRDIFRFSDTNPTSVPNAVTGTGEGLPGSLKVVGVMVGRPSEVVIEDTQTHETYFVEEGKTQGNFELLGARKDRVALKYQGRVFAVDLRR